MIPSLSICINNKCNFKCNYCSKDIFNLAIGENPLATKGNLKDGDLIKIIDLFISKGLNVFRLTGGEPFMSPNRVFKIIDFLSNNNESKIILNTNGSLLQSFYIDKLASIKNLKLKISLDTLQEKKYRAITGSNSLSLVKKNISEAVQKGILVEINCVVTKGNINEIMNIWDYCKANGVYLKLLDLYNRSSRFWNDNFVSLSDIETLLDTSEMEKSIETLSFDRGIPMRVYTLNDPRFTTGKIKLTIKDMYAGSTYLKYCKTCDKFPCGEGVFTIILDEDGRIFWCHKNSNVVASFNNDSDEFYSNISELLIKYNDSFMHNANFHVQH